MPKLLGRGPRSGMPKWDECDVCAFGFPKLALPPVLSRPCGRLSLFLFCSFPFRPPAFLPLLTLAGGGGGEWKGKEMGNKRDGEKRRKGRRRLGPDARAARSSLACRKPRRGLRGRSMRPMALILLNIAGKSAVVSFLRHFRGSLGRRRRAIEPSVWGKGSLSLSKSRRFPRLRLEILRPARKNGARKSRLARRPRPGEEGRWAAVSLGRFDFPIAFAGFLLR